MDAANTDNCNVIGKPERNIFITAVARAAKGLPDNPPSSAAWRKPLTDGGRGVCRVAGDNAVYAAFSSGVGNGVNFFIAQIGRYFYRHRRAPIMYFSQFVSFFLALVVIALVNFRPVENRADRPCLARIY